MKIARQILNMVEEVAQRDVEPPPLADNPPEGQSKYKVADAPSTKPGKGDKKDPGKGTGAGRLRNRCVGERR